MKWIERVKNGGQVYYGNSWMSAQLMLSRTNSRSLNQEAFRLVITAGMEGAGMRHLEKVEQYWNGRFRQNVFHMPVYES